MDMTLKHQAPPGSKSSDELQADASMQTDDTQVVITLGQLKALAEVILKQFMEQHARNLVTRMVGSMPAELGAARTGSCCERRSSASA